MILNNFEDAFNRGCETSSIIYFSERFSPEELVIHYNFKINPLIIRTCFFVFFINTSFNIFQKLLFLY